MLRCDLDLSPGDFESSWYIKQHAIKVCTKFERLVGRKTISFTHELSFFFINPPRPAAAQSMAIYSGALVVGKASIIGIKISPTLH